MADVFISYASEDRERASKLARALEAQGWSVWWDRKIIAGQSFDQVIEHELETAKSIVVLWSKNSISSEWVKNEAAVAAERGVLVPALIDSVKLPLEFRRKQAADMVGWDGNLSHGGFQALCDGVAARANIAGGAPRQPTIAPWGRFRWNRRWTLGAITAIAVALGFGAYWGLIVSTGTKSYLPNATMAVKPVTDKPIAIKPEANVPTKELFLAPGKAKLGARLGSETPVLTKGEPGMWKILEGQADFEGRRKQIAMHHDAQPVVTLNEGDYKVQVQVGDAKRIVDLSLKAGEQKPLEVVVGAGQVKLGARLGPGTPVLTKGEPGMWKILEGQADFEGRRKQIAMHHDAQPVVTLNEGDYKVQVQVGDATQVVDFTVKSGEQKVVEMDVTAKRQ